MNRFFLSGKSKTAASVAAGLLLWCCSVSLLAQSQETAKPKEHRWAVYAGIGPNYYFNNLVAGQNRVNELNYTFSARLMWEPEYFLSLGFETGYNRLYSMSGESASTGTVHIVNAAIPIQLVVSMKFFKYCYGTFSLGQAFLMNNVSTFKLGDYDASVLSLGDFSAAFGYRRPISDRFRLGAEIKAYYSGKLDDKNIALVFVGGYRLW